MRMRNAPCSAACAQFRAYPLFYMLMLGWQSFVLALLGIPWMLLTRKLPVPASLLARIGRPTNS